MDSEILQQFLAQAESRLPTIRGGILVAAQTGNIYGELNNSLRQVGEIKHAAALSNQTEAARIAGEFEANLEACAALKTPLTNDQSRQLLDKLAELEALLAQIHFTAPDFSDNISDFIDESFENLGLSEAFPAETVEAVMLPPEAEDVWEEEFEIDEEMLEIFGEEAEELVSNISRNLEILEKTPNDQEALLEVRRSAHTLKGSAGIVGLKALSGVAHRVEDLLDYLAENEIEAGEKIFPLLLTATDCFIALAGNDTSPQLTEKIARLYESFDELMSWLKSGDNQSPVRGENQAKQTTIDEPATAEIETPAIAESRLPQIENQNHHAPPESVNPKSVVRVSLEKLDDLVKIMSGLVFSRSVFEQRLAELEQQIGELHNSTRRLQQSTGKLETDFEADMLNTAGRQSVVVSRPLHGAAISPFINNGQPTIDNGQSQQSFDALEFDHYTDFHQTMRELLETTGDTSAINSELDNLKNNLETLFENQRRLIDEMQDKLLRLRLVSFGSLAVRLQRTVRVTADEEGKTAELTIEGGDLEIDTQILDALIEPLLHLLRNAVAHGIESPETRRLLGKPETGRIKVRVHDEGTHVILTVTDDGRGISAAGLKGKAVQNGYVNQTEAEAMSEDEALALVFLAGLTTAEEVSQVSGRGVGMNIVKNSIVKQQGAISIFSEPQKGTTFTVRLPMALAVTRALLVKAGGQTFAFPLRLVKHISRLSISSGLWSTAKLRASNQESAEKIQNKEFGKQLNNQNAPDRNSPIFYLNEILGLSGASSNNEDAPLLLIKTAETPCALIVDEIVKPEEIVIKSLGHPLQRIPELLGTTILGDGSVVPVLDLIYLLEQQQNSNHSESAADKKRTQTERQTTKDKGLTVLIVDDSPSVRHLTSNVIKDAGWTAMVAKNGLEALDVLQDARELPDVILSDVEMPKMDGYELLASLKKQEKLQAIPVVMITSRAGDKHRQKAIDLGVSEYLVKPFNDAKLIETIKNLTAKNF